MKKRKQYKKNEYGNKQKFTNTFNMFVHEHKMCLWCWLAYIHTHPPTHIQVFVLYLKSIKCHIDSIMTKQTERMVLSTNKPETKKPDPFHHGDD